MLNTEEQMCLTLQYIDLEKHPRQMSLHTTGSLVQQPKLPDDCALGAPSLHARWKETSERAARPPCSAEEDD